MKRKRDLMMLLICLTLLVTAVVPLIAQDDAHTLNRWTASSSTTVSSEQYALNGISGQAEAGAVHNGGRYQLYGGFLPSSVPQVNLPQGVKIFLPFIQK